MFTNDRILEIAMRQSAAELNCGWRDFTLPDNVIAVSAENAAARKYLTLPFACQLVSYGSNVVASVQEEYRELVEAYLKKYPAEHCFETPNMHVLNDGLQEKGLRICFMAEYFLPDMRVFRPLECPLELRLMEQADFQELYTETWSNALCRDRKQLDVLGVGAYAEGRLVGLAGCSADCESMWQIGIDVLPEYRRQGIASALTSRLAFEIMERGKVPFYCAAWSNIKSVRNALRSGFRPAWAELTAKDREFVNRMNR